MARLDNWSDAEITACINYLMAYADWAGGALAGTAPGRETQLAAELDRLGALIPTQGSNIIGSRIPYHVSSAIVDGKLQKECWDRWKIGP